MGYIYQGVSNYTFITQCSPRTYEEREAAIQKNAEWETSGIQRGIERYHKELEKDKDQFEKLGRSAFADSDVGSKLVDNCMRPMVAGLKPLIEEVEKAQEKAQDLFAKSGRTPKWCRDILVHEPEKVAAIIVRTVLAGIHPPVGNERPFTACAIAIADNIKMQRDFDLWKARQRQQVRDAKANNEKPPVNLYEVMTRKCKRIDSRAARSFMRLSTDYDRENLTKKEKIHFGAFCLDLLVRCGNGWFELRIKNHGHGRNIRAVKTIRLTQVALKAIEKDHNRCELNRPFLVPMLCEPASWRYEDGKSKSSGENLEESEVPPADSQIAQEIQSKIKMG